MECSQNTRNWSWQLKSMVSFSPPVFPCYSWGNWVLEKLVNGRAAVWILAVCIRAIDWFVIFLNCIFLVEMSFPYQKIQFKSIQFHDFYCICKIIQPSQLLSSSRIFPPPPKQTPFPIKKSLLFPIPKASGNQWSTFCLYEFVNYGHFTKMRSYNTPRPEVWSLSFYFQ